MYGARTGFHASDGQDPSGAVRPHDGRDLEQQLRSQFVCADPVSKALDIQIDALAPRRTTVLIVGESGVGKERVAREIHGRSPRRDRPFVAVDCTSFSGTLIESQLFGHVRGSFTGADRDHQGYIRAADGGTLFLDEVGDMPLGLQTRLLRVIQERCVTPIGQTEPVPVDLRIIAATHQRLPQLVRAGAFREDLFYRLSTYRMSVPSLRERTKDIVPLAEHFLDLQATIYEEPRRQLSPEAKQWLEAQPWHGNVRELANAIEFALVASSAPELMPEDFPEPAMATKARSLEPMSDVAPDGLGSDSILTMRQAEQRAVMSALRATNGDKTHAAKLLGISRSRIYSILARREQASDVRTNRSAS